VAKRILIAGANKGMGLAAVRAVLSRQDDTEVLLGARDDSRGASAIETLRSENPAWEKRIQLLQIDVADPGSVSAARDKVIDLYRAEPTPLFGLVNNAGIGLGSADLEGVVGVNTLGVKRVCDAFLPLVEDQGRIVIVSSASAPNFVSQCSTQRQQFFQDASLAWEDIESLIRMSFSLQGNNSQLNALGLGQLSAYGFSKACVSLYTLLLARDNPRLCINACTPGYIETDLTRPTAEARGTTPAELGMKAPEHGTVSIMHLLFGTPHGSGHYYGSDGKRSPMDRYRAPGDPEYMGD